MINRADAEGAAWLTAWRRNGALAQGTLRAIEPGELVVVHHGTLDPFTPRWRLFGVEFALSAVMHQLEEPEQTAFADFVSATPWGALGNCLQVRPPNTVEAVSRRARSLLAMWKPLATLRYIGAPTTLPEIVTFPGLNRSSINLDELVAELFAGTLALWGPAVGAARLRLERAVEAMAAADPTEAAARVLARMVTVARENPRMRGTSAADPAAIEAWVGSLSEEDRAELIPGVNFVFLRELYQLLRSDKR